MNKLPVTLIEVKEYLRLDGDGEDIILTALTKAAHEHCENYLGCKLARSVPGPVKQAILLLIAHFYEERAGEGIPSVVYTLLSAYRKLKW